MRIFVAGDVVGAVGLEAIEACLPRIKTQWAIDLAIINGENAASEGKGMTPRSVRRLWAAGADMVTGGNHSLRCRDVEPLLREDPRLIMPMNQPGCVGPGWRQVRGPNGCGVVIAQVQGQAFMPNKCTSPFAAVDACLAQAGDSIVLLDVHAETSSEKQALAWHVTGKAAAVWGTHTHVPTADARILNESTAFQTDIGMCGPYDSVIGFEADAAIAKFIGENREPLDVARASDVRIAGAVIDIDEATRCARSITPVQLALRDPIYGGLPPISFAERGL